MRWWSLRTSRGLVESSDGGGGVATARCRDAGCQRSARPSGSLRQFLLYYSGENTLHSLSATYKTLEQNDRTREAAHTHSPSWSLCELTPVPHGSSVPSKAKLGEW